MEKKAKRNKEQSTLRLGVKNGFLSIAFVLLAALITTAVMMKTKDPASNAYIAGIVCSALGGFLCSFLSLLNCKNDVFLCSMVSGVCFALIVLVGSLLFENTGKDIISRIVPIATAIVSSFVFGLLFRKLGRKKVRTLK